MPENSAALVIRPLAEDDAAEIAAAFAAQGWNKPAAQYRAYLEECRRGERTVLVAEQAGTFAGYVTVVWVSGYAPFRAAHIPEIVDFNVLIKYRRRGIGTALLDAAERLIAARSPQAGIGVCLTPDYGPALILYVKRGFIPDGRGAYTGGRHVHYGQQVAVDDELGIYLTKQVA
jgi:ribosomal protein S18 acetylase RimI-like enzyme